MKTDSRSEETSWNQETLEGAGTEERHSQLSWGLGQECLRYEETYDGEIQKKNRKTIKRCLMFNEGEQCTLVGKK